MTKKPRKTKETPKKVLEDEAVVKVKVGDKELEVSVKDLKRLYGQEAALTEEPRSCRQAQRSRAEHAQGSGYAGEDVQHKALERYTYAEIDMLVASKTLDAEQFAALRKEAQAAYEDFGSSLKRLMPLSKQVGTAAAGPSGAG